MIRRVWAMPSPNTFSIPPIGDLVRRWIAGGGLIVDPFARDSPFKAACLSNDLNPEFKCDYHMDALDFMRQHVRDESAAVVLFDPPYSPRQVAECYKSVGRQVNMETTQASFWSSMKSEISRVVAPGGICISCGWNSGGVGKSLGFKIEEILLVAHGGWHNDTIVTVERKIDDGQAKLWGND